MNISCNLDEFENTTELNLSKACAHFHDYKRVAWSNLTEYQTNSGDVFAYLFIKPVVDDDLKYSENGVFIHKELMGMFNNDNN